MTALDKSPDAFRTISEVAEDLDLPQHVLRFWETRFSQIKPLKRGGGRRYYRPDDVELLRGIRHLLYGEGYTIKGVQRILKEQGARFVMQVWREDGIPLQVAMRSEVERDSDEEEIVDVSEDFEADDPEVAEDAPPPRGVLVDPADKKGQDRSGGGLRFMDRFRHEKEVPHGSQPQAGGLTKDDVRRLQSTLFELLECKRLLDQAR